MSEKPTKVLDGVETIINDHLSQVVHFDGFHYKHKRSCNALCLGQPKSLDIAAMIANIYGRIENNLSIRPNRVPSSENWKIRIAGATNDARPDQRNESPEVTLERAIAQRWPKVWAYQMPTASGLFGSSTDKRRAVDLVYLRGNGCFDFVELKVKADTPLYAAMEILNYGLVYLASRKDSAKNLNYGNVATLPVMCASDISLVVLAPTQYYEKYKLEWLQLGLNDGLSKLLKRKGMPNVGMNFRFEKFPDGFNWEPKFTPDMLPEELVSERVCR